MPFTAAVNRRTFLAAGGAQAVVSGGGLGSGSGRQALAARLFSNPAAARRFGRLVLAEHPGLGTPGSPAWGRVLAALASLPVEEARAWLRRSRDADFQAGRTVEVAGYLLSAVEARCYALTALS